MKHLQEHLDKLKKELVETHTEVGVIDQEDLEIMAESMAMIIMETSGELVVDIAEHFVDQLGADTAGFNVEILTAKILESGLDFIEMAKTNGKEKQVWH